MTRLFLTRHGETEYNREGIEMGQLDVPLSETGRQQAQRLATRFRDVPVDVIYTSPLERSRRTAEILAEPHGVTVEPRDALKERSCGDMEGAETAVIGELLAEENLDWSTWRPEGGETRAEAVARARPVVEGICESHADGLVLVVAHSGINKGLLAAFVCDDASYGHRIKQGLACVNELEFRPGGTWRVHTVNDTSHLRDTMHP